MTALLRYPVLDLTLPSIGRRSSLYRLAPAGLGTSRVESMTSYVMRLADAHLLPVGSLISRVLGLDIHDGPVLRRGVLNELIPRARNANGIDVAAAGWSRAIARQTMLSNPEAMTLLPWAAVLPPVHLIGRGVRHCPECLNEMIGAGLVYEPLLWSMALYVVCSKHRLRLRDRCPDCRLSQVSLTGGSQPGICRSRTCRAWLGAGPRDDRPPTEWELFVADALANLIADSPNAGEVLDRDGPSKAIDEAMSMLGLSQNRFVAQTGVAETSVATWRRGDLQPSLDSVLRMCAIGGLSLPAFLRGRAAQTRDPISPDASPWTRPRRLDWQAIERAVAKCVADPSRPSLAAAAASVGLDRRQVRRHLPAQAKMIVQRHREREGEQTRKRMEAAIAAVEAAITKIDATGGDPSRRAVERLLPNGLQLRESALQIAWRRGISARSRRPR